MATLSGVRLVRTKQSLSRLIASGMVSDDQIDDLRAKLADIEDQINGAGVCHRCGRPLKDPTARYGPECQAAIEATQEEQ